MTMMMIPINKRRRRPLVLQPPPKPLILTMTMIQMVVMVLVIGGARATAEVATAAATTAAEVAPPSYMKSIKCDSHIEMNVNSITSDDGNKGPKKKTCCDRHVDLIPGVSFHWTYDHGSKSQNKFWGALEYQSSSSSNSEEDQQQQHWLGLGFSSPLTPGSMLGSKALIGIQPSAAKIFDSSNSQELLVGEVKLYDLQSKADNNSGIVLDPIFGNSKYYYNGEVVVNSNNVTMLFYLDQLSDLAHPHHPHHHDNNAADSDSTVIDMIFAIGKYNAGANGGTTLGYHHHRGSFRLDIDSGASCSASNNQPVLMAGPTSSDVDEVKAESAATVKANKAKATVSSISQQIQSSYGNFDHRAAFAAHGFFMTLSFAVIVPFGMISAWLRSLIPKWWIYVHVLCNSLACLLITIGIACGFGGVMMRLEEEKGQQHSNRSHMSITHHWVGLLCFLGVLFQVLTAFRRPVQHQQIPKEGGGGGLIGASSSDSAADDDNKRSCCYGKIPLPFTPREKWHVQHTATAIIVIAMAIYQLQSGLRLYGEEYNNDGATNETYVVALWGWIVFLALNVITVKCVQQYHRRRKNKSKSSRLQKLQQENLMPQHPEEEYELGTEEHHDESLDYKGVMRPSTSVV